MPTTRSRNSPKSTRRPVRKASKASGSAKPNTGTATHSLPSVVNVHVAKTQLSRLLARVEAGEEITIARAGQPFARLVPLAPTVPRGPRVPGRFKGMFGPLADDEAMAPLPPEYSGFDPSPTDPLEHS